MSNTARAPLTLRAVSIPSITWLTRDLCPESGERVARHVISVSTSEVFWSVLQAASVSFVCRLITPHVS